MKDRLTTLFGVIYLGLAVAITIITIIDMGSGAFVYFGILLLASAVFNTIFFLSPESEGIAYIGFYICLGASAVCLLFFIMWNEIAYVILTGVLLTIGILLFSRLWAKGISSARDERRKRALEEVLSSFKEKILNASQAYSSIHFKKLAKIIGCNDRLLLNLISKMVVSKEINAVIEFPSIIFKKTQ